MFPAKSSDNDSALEQAIDGLFQELSLRQSDSEEYSTMVDQLTKLYKLKEINAPKPLSPDTLAIVVGNLVGIVLIVGHERMHLITSKALNFVLRLR